MVDFYKKEIFLLHPAIFESYGTVVQEAISSGLLVIGTDKTGTESYKISDNFDAQLLINNMHYFV